MQYNKANIVAEIGCNHMGKMDLAFNLIKMAKDCGANVAKFQKRNSLELLSSEQYNAPHPNPINSYGNTYGEHREFLEFSIEQHIELKKYSEEIGIDYSTSVWDITSAKEICSIEPKFIKVPSACNNHMDMLRILRDEYTNDIHISLGMTTREEEEALINFFNKNNSLSRVVLYSCTSGYPVPFEQTCLLEVRRIVETYKDKVKAIGFSGHHLGIAIDIAAYTLGANWIERHFTQDRTWKGSDHAASLEATGLSKLVRDLNATNLSLNFKTEEILEIELPQRDKLKWKKID